MEGQGGVGGFHRPRPTHPAATGNHSICPTGMAWSWKSAPAPSFAERRRRLVLLHCNSTYPTPFKDVNLRYLERCVTLLRLRLVTPAMNGALPIAAVALGAAVSRNTSLSIAHGRQRPQRSLLPDEFAQMVRAFAGWKNQWAAMANASARRNDESRGAGKESCRHLCPRRHGDNRGDGGYPVRGKDCSPTVSMTSSARPCQ